MTHSVTESAQQLRKRAEQQLQQTEQTAHKSMSPETAQQLIHELQVHQIELEMQNDELRRQQQELECLRARYFDLYNLAPVGYLTLSDQGLIIEANLTAATLLGLTRKALSKRPLASFIAADDQDRYYRYRKQPAETAGSPEIVDLRMRRADGSLFWASIQTIPAQEIDGMAGHRMMISDCSQQKEAEIELRTAKEQWVKIFDSIDDVIAIHDPDMRIVKINKAGAKLLQVMPADIIGKYCYEVFCGTGEPCQGCPEVVAQGSRLNQQAIICHDNLGKTFDVASFPLLDEGRITGYVCIAKDITDCLQMEEQLRQAQKMEAIGVLAGGIAHDFNNILVPILGYAELAECRLAPDDPLTTDLQQIIKGALRAKDMIAQILAFSRKAPQKRQSFEPQLVVREVLKFLEASLPRTIRIESDIAGDCGTIMVDPTQFHQIVMNLCINAQHAMMQQGGVLTVRMARTIVGKDDQSLLTGGLIPGPYLLLAVSDTGSGMDYQIMERIFEPYFTLKPQGEGSGLGLSVVHGIVKSYHGHITVHSEPGKGTSFQVYLPSMVEQLSWPEKESSLTETAGVERILLVDDEELITDMFDTILTRLGYQVIVFNDSLEALAFITQDSTAFDLLVTDMSMPNLTGLELVQKTLAVRPDLPVILCTGFNQMISKEEAKALGIHTYLEKPVLVKDLTEAIRQALDDK